jgi:ABC-type Fe3+/spermidine/putrescine transport system ATPase subunit
VREILKRAGTTAIFVTHDQEEAFFLGDRVAVMNRGRIEQTGTPEAVFHEPASRFVARFLGIADFLPGQIENGAVRTLLGDLPVPNNAGDATNVDVMIRPDDVQIVPCETSAGQGEEGQRGRGEEGKEGEKSPMTNENTEDSSLGIEDSSLSQSLPVIRGASPLPLCPSAPFLPSCRGTVSDRQFRGTHYLYRVDLTDGTRLHVMAPHTAWHELGATVQLRLVPDHDLTLFSVGDSCY